MVTESVFLPIITAAKTAIETVITVDGAAGTLALAALESADAPAGFDFDASWRAVTPGISPP